MTKKHSNKRALVASMLALALCFTMLIGTTFAWFTDSATSSGNVIKTGTLDVEMYWADGKLNPADTATTWTDATTGPIFNNDKWEPGYTEVRHVKIENLGSLALKYKVQIIANGYVSELADVIDVYYLDPAEQIADASALTEDKKLGTLAGALANLGNTGAGNLDAGEAHTITIALKMKEDAGNEYQKLSIGSSFSIKVIATQATVEEDSFGDQYDKDAIYSESTSAVIGANESISVNNVSVTLPDTASEAKYTLMTYNQTEEVNSNGETTYSLNIELLKDGVKAEAGQEYTVSINVGKSAIITGVTHNGAAVTDYFFNPVTKILTFTTDSFSPFAFSYVDPTYKVSSAEELQAVLSEIKTSAKQVIPGETGNKAYRENAIIVLEDDIVIDSTTEFMYTDGNGSHLHFYGVKGILDLNGHSITVSADALLEGKTSANAVLLIQYSNIDIIGEGRIEANNKSAAVYAWANCSVNIWDGEYVTNAYERNESAVYVNNASAKVDVYGGTYTNTEYAFNVHDNCGTTTTIVLHEGIEYYTFLKNGSTDVTQSDINNGRIALADGCELVNADGKNVVAKAN